MVEYGVQVWKHPDKPKQMDVTKALGVSQVRVDVHWREIELSRGIFDWSDIDSQVNLARARGIEPLLLIVSTPPWASAGGGEYEPPSDMSYFGDFCRAVVERYHPKILEMWNEPAWFWTGTVTQLVELYRAGYNAMKAVDPSIIVLGTWGASTLGDWGRIVDTIRAGLMDVCDGFAVHEYVPEGYEGYPSVAAWLDYQLSNYFGALNAAGVSTKPIYVTEFGFNSATLGEAEAARRLQEQLEWFEAHKGECLLKTMVYYDLWDNQYTFSLVKDIDLTPRRIYYVYHDRIPTPISPLMSLAWLTSGLAPVLTVGGVVVVQELKRAGVMP